MRQKFMRYALLPLGIVLVISLIACTVKLESVGTGPDIQWYKTFGGSQNEIARSVRQTTDGSYIICGMTGSYDNAEVLLIKTDTAGNKLWDKTFGGKEIATGSWVQQTTDGGYIICGVTGSWDKAEVLLMKTDTEGNKLWDKTFGGKEMATGNFVRQTTDGGYIICGMTGSLEPYKLEALLIKTDADGNKLWDKAFSDEGETAAASVQQTKDGGYIVTIMTGSYDESEFLLMKTDADGNKLWGKTFGSKEIATGNSVQQTADGGYILCGNTESHGAVNVDVWLIKTDADGNKLWDKTFGGKEMATSNFVQQTTDGGYIICGMTGSLEPDKVEALLIKTDADGNKLWGKTFGGEGVAIGDSAQQTVDGGYIVCGTTRSYEGKVSKALLLKIAPER